MSWLLCFVFFFDPVGSGCFLFCFQWRLLQFFGSKEELHLITYHGMAELSGSDIAKERVLTSLFLER
jgi:hypothetical protein